MNTLIFIGALIGFVLVWIWYRYRRFQDRERMGLKGPKWDFFSGNLLDLIKFTAAIEKNGDSWDDRLFRKWIDLYGDEKGTIGIYIGPQLQVLVSDPEMMKEIYIKQFNNFTDRTRMPMRDCHPMTNSLLAIDGEHGWKDLRASISPTFSTGKIKAIYEQIQDKMDLFVQCIHRREKDQLPFNIYDDFQALTLDVIGKVAFAIDSNSLENRQDVFYQKCQELFRNVDLKTSKLLVMQFFFPEFGVLWRRMSGLTKMTQSEKVLLAGLSNVLDTRQHMIEDFKGTDVVQLLLQLAKSDKQTGKILSRDRIVANLHAFLLAGYETTSTALAFTTWLITKHPEVQSRLQAEIDEQGGDSLSYDAVMKMPYLDAVYKESLRYYPPVNSGANRVCVRDTTVCGRRFRKGTVVAFNAYYVHHSASNWENPDDFNPERFMNGEQHHPMVWVPFGVGPRNCIGMRFAEMEYKMALAHLLRDFTLVPGPQFEEKLTLNQTFILLRPTRGVTLNVEARTKLRGAHRNGYTSAND